VHVPMLGAPAFLDAVTIDPGGTRLGPPSIRARSAVRYLRIIGLTGRGPRERLADLGVRRLPRGEGDRKLLE
jgi:hypothetical protein